MGLAMHDDIRSPVLVIMCDTDRTSAKHAAQQWEFSLNFYNMNNSRDFYMLCLFYYMSCESIAIRNVYFCVTVIIEFLYMKTVIQQEDPTLN